MSEDYDRMLVEAIRSGQCGEIVRAIGAIGNANHVLATGETGLTVSTVLSVGPEGTLSRVRCLVGLGALVASEVHVEGGGTSVHHAARNGHFETLSALLAAGGRVALTWFDDLGRTPLVCAVQSGDVRTARLLLQAGSPVNAHDEKTIGDTALVEAIRLSNLPMVELLLQFGADPTVQGWMRMTALDLVAEHRNDAIGELFERYFPPTGRTT